jgi:5-methylthioadenosine/S-adenosylhomocysteine deaminase
LANSSQSLLLPRRSVLFSLAAASAFAQTRKRADWLLSAGTVVTMDAERRVIPDGAVALAGGEILAVGTKAELLRQYAPQRVLDRPEAILLPGLINTHAHASMSLLRGIADDKRLQDWLENYIFPAEARNVTKDFCYQGARLACLEMMLSGTTTYADMYYFEEEVARATQEAGLRGVLGQTVIGFPVADAKTPPEALARCEAFMKQFAGNPLISACVAPHAMYTNSRETLVACRALADKYKTPLIIHLSETQRENDDMRKAHGKSPTQTLADWGIFDGPTLAAHVIWVDEADRRVLAAKGVGISHCPSSNMKLASGVAPVTQQLAAGLHVGLGTDGPAGSNNDFNLFEEMDLASKLQKITQMDPTALPARTVLEMATLHGAAAVGKAGKLGVLAAGALADLIFVRCNVANASPVFDVYSQLVFASKGSDVSDVFVQGRPIVRQGESLTLKTAEILAQASKYQKQIVLSLKK